MGEAPTQESSIPIGYEERHQGREASQITHYDPYARTAIPPLSPWTHVAIFTSILAPVALLPYLAVRRHLLSLHRQVSEIGAANAALQRDLRAALLESCIRREEHDRLGSTMNEIRRDLERVRAEQAAKDLQRARVEERTKSDIHELLEENKRMRTRLSSLRDLSPSLADIAAFMHEVEVQQGFASRKNDGRGIERIRQFAYKLQNMLTAEADANNDYVPSPPPPPASPQTPRAEQKKHAAKEADDSQV